MVGRSFGQKKALRRFRHEARAAARLNHPNIASVHDYGVFASQGAYLVMELVHGTTLREKLERAGTLPPQVAADWFAQLLDGLAAAHQAGVVHRDLKPENLIDQARPSAGPVVKIVDFGLAELRPVENASTETQTSAGIVMGTLGYMSPEQLSGGAVDERTDIFAVGVILFEVLTGGRPFQGETHGELLRAVLDDTHHLPGVAPEMRALDAVLQRFLAKSSEERFASATAARQALVPALSTCARLDPPHVATAEESREA